MTPVSAHSERSVASPRPQYRERQLHKSLFKPAVNIGLAKHRSELPSKSYRVRGSGHRRPLKSHRILVADEEVAFLAPNERSRHADESDDGPSADGCHVIFDGGDIVRLFTRQEGSDSRWLRESRII